MAHRRRHHSRGPASRGSTNRMLLYAGAAYLLYSSGALARFGITPVTAGTTMTGLGRVGTHDNLGPGLGFITQGLGRSRWPHQRFLQFGGLGATPWQDTSFWRFRRGTSRPQDSLGRVNLSSWPVRGRGLGMTWSTFPMYYSPEHELHAMRASATDAPDGGPFYSPPMLDTIVPARKPSGWSFRGY